MGKIEEAIKKINDEIQKDPTNQYLALVGEHIIDRITTEAAAASVLAEDKTLAGALDTIRRRLEKQAMEQYRASSRQSSCVSIVAPQEDIYSQARTYFGLSAAANPQSPAGKGICLSLEDFL